VRLDAGTAVIKSVLPADICWARAALLNSTAPAVIAVKLFIGSIL
jgi:hypothetical protein